MPITSMRKLASEIAKREGKKVQARIGEVREILAIYGDIVFEDVMSPESLKGELPVEEIVFEDAAKRAEKRAKKKKK